jgi:hypothetical protein
LTDNRIFSKDACTVCGRLGDPHAEWCADVSARLERENVLYAPGHANTNGLENRWRSGVLVGTGKEA